MRRLILFAIGLSALVLMADARTGRVPPEDITAMSGAGSCALTADSDGPSDADLKWCAQQHTIGVVNESIWKFSPLHLQLGATRSLRSVDTTLATDSPPSAASAPHYLRHTPLLI